LNGQYAALGHGDGSIVLLKTENLEEIMKVEYDDFTNSMSQAPISCLAWHVQRHIPSLYKGQANLLQNSSVQNSK
jgi:hypothetical protein